MYYIVDVLKALACLLIANFHSDILFPDNLRILAFCGDIGNNIFFLISGFTIWPSVERSTNGDWCQWYQKRLMRICPMVFFFYILTWITGGVQIASFKEAFSCFVFPTIYWFTGAILVLYILFYVVEKCIRARVARLGICVMLVVLHLVYDSLYAERYFVGFMAMLIGAEIRRETDSITERRNLSAGLLGCAGFFTGLYCVLKLLRMKGVEVLGLIHLGIGITTILVGVSVLLWGIANDSLLKVLFSGHVKLWKCICAVSGMTMAVYLTMGFNDRILMKQFLQYVPFPLSYILDLLASMLIAYFLTLLDSAMHKKYVKNKADNT